MRQPPARWYPADLEENPTVSPEDGATIDVFAGNLDVNADFKLADLPGGPDLCCRVSICFDYSSAWEACLVDRAFVLFPVAERLLFSSRRAEVMSGASILEGSISAFESPLASNTSCIGNGE